MKNNGEWKRAKVVRQLKAFFTFAFMYECSFFCRKGKMYIHLFGAKTR